MAFLQVGCLIAFVLLLLLAAWQDLRTMRIADGNALGIAVSFVLWAASGLVLGTTSPAIIGWALASAAILFAIAVAAFARGVLGGGDVKLLAAASLFAGPALMSDFLTVTALAGGVLAVMALAGAPIGPEAPAAAATARSRLQIGLPYGPAIAAGGLWVAALLGARLHVGELIDRVGILLADACR